LFKTLSNKDLKNAVAAGNSASSLSLLKGKKKKQKGKKKSTIKQSERPRTHTGLLQLVSRF